jgi:hypothetical protein
MLMLACGIFVLIMAIHLEPVRHDDAFAWPGGVHHHIDDQHRRSEAAFFQRLGVDPFDLCAALYGAFAAGGEPAAALVAACFRRLLFP